MAADRSNEAILALHRRLLDGDPTASEEASRLLLISLLEETQHQYPRLDEQVIADAVVEAFLDYFEHPSHADKTGESGPRAFLKKAAWRNAANLYRSGKRRKSREELWIAENAGSTVEDCSALGTLIQEEEKGERDKQIANLNALLPEERDREVLRLRLKGERRVKAFSEALGITHLPAPEQRRIVKQTKDRIDKVLKRRGGHRK